MTFQSIRLSTISTGENDNPIANEEISLFKYICFGPKFVHCTFFVAVAFPQIKLMTIIRGGNSSAANINQEMHAVNSKFHFMFGICNFRCKTDNLYIYFERFSNFSNLTGWKYTRIVAGFVCYLYI